MKTQKNDNHRFSLVRLLIIAAVVFPVEIAYRLISGTDFSVASFTKIMILIIIVDIIFILGAKGRQRS